MQAPRNPRTSGRSTAIVDAMNEAALVLLLVPILVIQIGLMVFALWDITRPERRVRGDSKLMWGLIVIFVGMLGPIVYLAIGREEA